MTKINYKKGITTLETIVIGLIILIIIIIGLGSGYRNFNNRPYYQTQRVTYPAQSTGYQSTGSTSYTYYPGSTSTSTTSWWSGSTTGGTSWWNGSPSGSTPPGGNTIQPASTCLPGNIKMSDIVSATETTKVTVQQKLNELAAGCHNGKLISASTQKEIRFYQLKGCWGTPPPNADQIMQQQESELATLRSQYTVIEMTCNPGGIPLQ
jgi:hypothetical protein